MKHKKLSMGLLGLCASFALTSATAQTFNRGTVNASSTVPTTNEQLRVTNGLITQFVSGNVGLGGAADKWIGIGDPFQTVTPPNPSNLVYGYRAQWNQKALIMNLKGTTVSGTGVPTEAEFQWGGPAEPNWTGSLNFNYIDNFASNTPLYRVLELTSGGNTISRTGLLGHSRAGVFGGFGSGDQWIGIGQPTNNGLPTGTPLPFYGMRIQNGTQSLLLSLRTNTQFGTPAPAIDWGSGSFLNEPLEIRHFTNAADPNSFRRIMEFNPSGIVRVGPTYTFNLGFQTLTTSEQFQVNSATGQSNIYLRTAGAGTGSSVTNLTAQAFGGTGTFSSATAIYGEAYSSQSAIGVFGTATSASSVGYGLYGRIASAVSGSTNYAVYGNIINSTTGNNWAGYFAGRVFANQYISSSDAQLKQNIKNEDGSVLEKLKQLRPVNYSYKTTDKSFESMGLPEGLRHGFIAQEVEKVFPELVTDVKQPKFTGKPENGKNIPVEFIEFKGIDYNGMISMLTKAVQEQQTQIELLTQKLEKKAANEVLVVPDAKKPGMEAIREQAYMLAQNQPNPFTASTTIRYTVPAGVTNSMIGVFDLNGKMLLQYRLEPGASNQVVINGSSLQAGMYLYSLLINGEEVITRKMVLTK
jgi:hypothetical protein